MFLVHVETVALVGTEKPEFIRFQLVEDTTSGTSRAGSTARRVIEEILLPCPFRGRKYRDIEEYMRVECARLNALPVPAAVPQGDGLW